ncbi:S-4TM family putative pore-forming effector [Actinomadura coerulea]|uniref:S-4TM family putative pore-forming effector n=1 Tax=Actinomadura coerulea TaxID=46159 RepID=UPI00343AE366
MKIEEQNSEWSVQRLLAEEALRDRSLRMQAARILLALLMAVAAPLAAAMGESGRLYVGLGGAALTLASVLLLETRERAYRAGAVECKEQFDASLFGIPPTTGPRGRTLTEEEICAEAAKRGGDRQRMRDWYPDPGNLPHGFAVLLCQRASLVWDIRLRRRFAAVAAAVVGIWAGSGLLSSLTMDLSLRSYMLTWIVPSTPLLVIGIQAMTVHRDIANRRERLLSQLSFIWQAAKDQNRDVDPAEFRVLQEAVFHIRNDAPVLPAFFTRRHSPSFYKEMSEASRQLKGTSGAP